MAKTYNHKHSSIPLHSPAQGKMFFALGRDLGYQSEEIKNRACSYFQLDCFNEITVEQMNSLLDKLIKRKDEVESSTNLRPDHTGKP